MKKVFLCLLQLHSGLCVPPKCVPIAPDVEDACKTFVEGDLLEQSIQPLELCQEPKSFESCHHGCGCNEAVEDPTPSAAEVVEASTLTPSTPIGESYVQQKRRCR